MKKLILWCWSLMMISKVNQIGFLSQVFKYLLTDLVRFMMVFWQPGTKCSAWNHSARLCWRKDPCQQCQQCWCSRGRKLKYKIYWAWSGWCLWQSPEPHHGGRAQQICNWILLVITRLIACVNGQIQGNLVNNFSWAERKPRYFHKVHSFCRAMNKFLESNRQTWSL